MTEQADIESASHQDVHSGARQNLEAELAQVEQRIGEAIAELFPPFSQMVAAQLRHSYPLMRAAVVLTAGVAAPDNAIVRDLRIDLAAAMEMLHLAINVHMLLGEGASGEAPNPTVLGSTILAGDYCFSRSANLAARTGDPVVVEIFSNALKRVSEGHLRRFFDPTGEAYNEDRELFVAGVNAAMHLGKSSAQARSEATRIVEMLADHPKPTERLSLLPSFQSSLQNELAPNQVERWLAFLNWRADQ